jgi:branched-chain amino acid transport system permease protein
MIRTTRPADEPALAPGAGEPTGVVARVRANWLFMAVLVFLVGFPFLVAALTGSNALGEIRGERYLMRGESVRWQAVLIELFVLGILAMSYNLLFGFTGVVSFGHALFFGLGGYAVGMMLELTEVATLPALILGILIGLLLNALLGFVIGLVSLRLKGVYFAIFTLAVAEMFFIYFGRLPATSAEDGFAITRLPGFIDPTQNRLVFYYVALILFVGTFTLIRRLINSPTGAIFQAIRENEERAQAIGFNTLRFKLIAITIAAMLASAAGMLHVLLNKKVGPEILSVAYTVNPLLMVIIGGIGTFSGPVLGAAGLHLLDTLFRTLKVRLGATVIELSNFWDLLLGIVFIAVVLVFPQGVVGTINRLRLRRGNRR